MRPPLKVGVDAVVETVEKPPDIWHITVKYDIGKHIAY